jgi:hypothetical protein
LTQLNVTVKAEQSECRVKRRLDITDVSTERNPAGNDIGLARDLWRVINRFETVMNEPSHGPSLERDFVIVILAIVTRRTELFVCENVRAGYTSRMIPQSVTLELQMIRFERNLCRLCH